MSLVQAVRSPESADEPNALNLFHVQWWPLAGGDGLELPSMRIPLDRIDSWWLGGGKKLRAGGGNWFFGVAVPVDLS
jgi:hypothetical protein